MAAAIASYASDTLAYGPRCTVVATSAAGSSSATTSPDASIGDGMMNPALTTSRPDAGSISVYRPTAGPSPSSPRGPSTSATRPKA
jgi:hypothetical protein